MEIIAYNIPSCTGSVIPAEVVLEGARRGYFRYLKESSGDFDYFQRLVTEGGEVGVDVLEGEEPHIAKGLLAGAVGIVPVCANFEPATFLRACQAHARRRSGGPRPLPGTHHVPAQQAGAGRPELG